MVLEVEADSEHVGVEHADCLVEELLAGLVAAEDDDADRLTGHLPEFCSMDHLG